MARPQGDEVQGSNLKKWGMVSLISMEMQAQKGLDNAEYTFFSNNEGTATPAGYVDFPVYYARVDLALCIL